MGTITGILSVIPPTIDAMTWTRVWDDGGGLAQQGWGNKVSIGCFILLPLLTLALVMRRPSSE